MFGNNSVLVMLATALIIAAVRVPAAPCILSNAATDKTCAMDCCKSKSCCETSHQRTGLPAQPLARASSDQQNIATLPSTVPVAVFNYVEAAPFIFSKTEHTAHSPAPLALICIRLI